MWNSFPPPSSISGKGNITINSKGSSLIACIAYISTSIIVTLFNKLLLSNAEYKFPYPFFTAFFQLVLVLFIIIASNLFKSVQHVPIPALTWDWNVALRIAPLSIVYMCVIIFNPLFLQHVEVTTYPFAHSLTIAFMIIFSYYMLKVETPKPVNSACLIIMCGSCIGAMGYLNFSIVGAFYTIAWPIVLVVYRIYLKKTLAALKSDIGCLIYYNTIMAIVVLAPFVLLSGELNEIFSTVWFWDEFGFWLQMVLTTLTGLIVQISMLAFLVHTSPLSLTVASVSKTSIQALLVAIIFGNRLSLLNFAGIVISLSGSCYYTYLNLNEPKKYNNMV